MESGPSGQRPLKRFCAEKARVMLDEWMNNLDSDEETSVLLSDEDNNYSASSSSESGSSSGDSDCDINTSGCGKPYAGKGKGPMPKKRKAGNKTARSSSNTNETGHDEPVTVSFPATTTSSTTFAWKEVHEGATRNNFRFVRHESHGVNKDRITSESTELDCLLTLLNEQIIELLLANINDYARGKLVFPQLRHSVYYKFQPVTRPELLKFFAILIAMGLNPRPSIKSYWSVKEAHLFTPWYGQTMARNRFQALFHTFLHAGGDKAEAQDKIEPFLNKLVASFQDAFYPGINLSVDEMVIGYKGRWKNKQFNATKPSKYHIKTFGLCDSKTGYVVNVFTYYGSATAYHPDLDVNCTMAEKVFQKLLAPLTKGHHIFADRFYTSIPLLEFLSREKHYYTGTVDTRRKNFPPALKSLVLSHLEMKWYMHEDKYLTVAFRDKKAKRFVSVVTSQGSVSKTQIKTKHGDVEKPTAIDLYNQNMNGCDRADQLVGYYGCHKRKSHKWWKKIFHWLLEICHVNAAILFRESHPEHAKMSLAQFKTNLIAQLLAEAANSLVEKPVDIALAQQPQPSVKMVTDNPTIRLAANIHIAKSAKKDRCCQVCSKPGARKRTRSICADCPGQPFLCKEPCFRIWHTKNIYKS